MPEYDESAVRTAQENWRKTDRDTWGKRDTASHAKRHAAVLDLIAAHIPKPAGDPMPKANVYYVERWILDQWRPMTLHGEGPPPTVSKGGKLYLQKVQSIGAQIRALPVPVAPEDQGLPLDALRALYGGADVGMAPAAQPEAPGPVARVAPDHAPARPHRPQAGSILEQPALPGFTGLELTLIAVAGGAILALILRALA
ncbi:hypothetical protein [Ponticoccus alexandrii]|uniref:Uncharacterized protein n=1 Tax=Ponticoccus alexandrii TaxID=1943633 RepID=A0ABX7F753_9RHOB|nr:hypothetical protein [Ponticoccus alexandrii]ETA53999.1 hypothetical protein P279_00180 [Rhodobacteraceae bacterium PD-2]QRF66348.1 hypothetical protein GQA70_08525 [Ponticoccus alexandrii]